MCAFPCVFFCRCFCCVACCFYLLTLSSIFVHTVTNVFSQASIFISPLFCPIPLCCFCQDGNPTAATMASSIVVAQGPTKAAGVQQHPPGYLVAVKVGIGSFTCRIDSFPRQGELCVATGRSAMAMGFCPCPWGGLFYACFVFFFEFASLVPCAPCGVHHHLYGQNDMHMYDDQVVRILLVWLFTKNLPRSRQIEEPPTVGRVRRHH